MASEGFIDKKLIQGALLVNSNGNSLGMDFATRSLQVMQYEHHEIHGGSHYYFCDFDEEQLNGVVQFLITTPDTTKWSHMTFKVSSILGSVIQVYEGAGAVGAGTSADPFNSNRNSGNVSNLTVVKDPVSVGTAGTIIYAATAGANRTAGNIARSNEIILKQNTTYNFKMTSLANSNVITYCGGWYEHADKTN